MNEQTRVPNCDSVRDYRREEADVWGLLSHDDFFDYGKKGPSELIITRLSEMGLHLTEEVLNSTDKDFVRQNIIDLVKGAIPENNIKIESLKKLLEWLRAYDSSDESVIDDGPIRNIKTGKPVWAPNVLELFDRLEIVTPQLNNQDVATALSELSMIIAEKAKELNIHF